MMQKLISYFFLLLCSSSMWAQAPIQVNLWPEGPIVKSTNTGGARETKPGIWANNNTASMQVYLPEGQVDHPVPFVLICPGGGYYVLSVEHEGADFAPWFNERGIAVGVLHYRMPAGVHGVPLADLHQAMRYIRTQAKEWNINPESVGVMGFSAGGHLAAMGAVTGKGMTQANFQILVYPVISMCESYGHLGSRNNLMGKNPPVYLQEFYSPEKRVTAQTPPAFLTLTHDDGIVPSHNSLAYYLALQQAKQSVEMHVYPKGGHGWGMRDYFPFHDEFLQALDRWLHEQGCIM